jgi:hypothetical protein
MQHKHDKGFVVVNTTFSFRESAAETVYKERCMTVDNGEAWAKYMSIAGDASDKHDIITLMYAEDGLISIDDNREGRAAAFGDDIAIESLASEYHREIFVVVCGSLLPFSLCFLRFILRL